MSLPIRLIPEAKFELESAVEWYESQRPGLGIAFLDAVKKRLLGIAATPQMHTIVYKEVRKGVVRKFPYIIYYREQADELLVISIFHTAQDPAIWQSRVDRIP